MAVKKEVLLLIARKRPLSVSVTGRAANENENGPRGLLRLIFIFYECSRQCVFSSTYVHRAGCRLESTGPILFEQRSGSGCTNAGLVIGLVLLGGQTMATPEIIDWPVVENTPIYHISRGIYELRRVRVIPYLSEQGT